MGRKLTPDMPVHVHVFGRWRPGRITRLAQTMVWVRYARNQHGDSTEQAFPPAAVLPAEGVDLRAVQDLHPGDVVLVSGARWPVAQVTPVPHGRRRREPRMRIRYTHDDEVTLTASTLLRVVSTRANQR